YYTANIRLTNPSPYEIQAKVYFDCKDCTTDVKIFGAKIGEKTIDYRSFFTLEKDDVKIAPFVTGNDGPAIKLTFSPKFILKNYLRIYTPDFINFFIKIVNKNYKNSFVIPYYSLFIGEKSFRGLIVADVYASSFGYMGVTPSVGSTIEIHATGMPVLSFVFLLVLLVLLVYFSYTKIKSYKKDKHKK
ncbi:MAG: hypothetical protein N3D75_04330, partial [Candidatus Aenigmarchaeota archaeon]|nr:hypothetical protein [Candidatus Aenigmarchaeota archaeon]